MKFSQLEQLLKDYGCTIVRAGGNHQIWYSPITDKKFPVGHHGSKEVPKNTERQILKQAGIKK